MTRTLDDFPRIPLAHLPTPLEALPRLSAVLGGSEIWVKRDDCTGLATGGNKSRKLEFLMGAALEDGVDTVITIGGVQSNHARQTAAAAARLGLRCQLVLPRVVPRSGPDYEHNGNVLLDRLFGAELYIVEDEVEVASCLQDLLGNAKAEGRRAVVHPPGGSTAVGALGYVAAAFELGEQIRAGAPDFQRAYVAIGSSGTVAGLAMGIPLAALNLDVTGVCVAGDASKHRPDTEAILTDLRGLLETKEEPSEIRYEERFLGEGYGVPAESTLEAIRLCATTEGLLIDPVYTGKAMAALIADVRAGHTGEGPVLFWHTGGSPGLYAYREELDAALDRAAIRD